LLLESIALRLSFRNHQVPVTLVCVITIISGVPFGAHIAWLSSSRTGWPFEVIRTADEIH
jgi:hypothetical protein